MPVTSEAYVRLGIRWTDRTIGYANLSPWAGAVEAAVRVWNRSGVRLRFKRVPRARARVTIRSDPGSGFATPLYHRGAVTRTIGTA